MTTIASTKATDKLLSIGMRPHLFDSNSKSPADLAVQRGQIDVGILVDVLLHFEIAFSPLTAKKSRINFCATRSLLRVELFSILSTKTEIVL